MVDLIHGGDIYGTNKKLIDFSANINPLGLPKKVKETINNNLEEAEHYPDPLCRKLRKSIGNFEKTKEDFIFCGNGAADIIYRLPIAIKAKKALVPAPTFSEYEIALNTFSCKVEHFYLKEESNFELTEDIVKVIENNDYDIVFICNPNNPTGLVASKQIMLSILDACKKKDCILVVDECFLDFCKNHEELSLAKSVQEYDNLIILKAFTKIYAMPGVRLGYCICSNMEIIKGLYMAGQPWAVSQIAQIAGAAALQEKEYLDELVSLINEQREYLVSELDKLGIKTYKSQANYILLNIGDSKFYNSNDFKEKLFEKGILIRACSNYEGLGKDFFRIAVRGKLDNSRLIIALQEIAEEL